MTRDHDNRANPIRRTAGAPRGFNLQNSFRFGFRCQSLFWLWIVAILLAEKHSGFDGGAVVLQQHAFVRAASAPNQAAGKFAFGFEVRFLMRLHQWKVCTLNVISGLVAT